MFTDLEIANISKNCASLIENELADNFAKRKRDSLLLADSYSRIIDTYDEPTLENTAHRVRSCAAYLEYWLDPHSLNGTGYQKLKKAYFCSNVLCPMCSWRKARKISNQLTLIMEQLNDYRFIFLTLTIKNVMNAKIVEKHKLCLMMTVDCAIIVLV